MEFYAGKVIQNLTCIIKLKIDFSN